MSGIMSALSKTNLLWNYKPKNNDGLKSSLGHWKLKPSNASKALHLLTLNEIALVMLDMQSQRQTLACEKESAKDCELRISELEPWETPALDAILWSAHAMNVGERVRLRSITLILQL